MITTDWAIPPGEYLAEILIELSTNQAEFSRRLDLCPHVVHGLINGEEHLTSEIASRLEQVVKVPAHIWLGLEHEYRSILKTRLEAQTSSKTTDNREHG